MTVVMGIDPGISGAVAFYFMDAHGRVAVDDIPVAGGEINTAELARQIRIHRPTIAVVEKAQAMPGNGGVSMFNYGRSYGDVRGVIGAMEIPLHFVTPATWKRHHCLSSDKEQSRLYAIRMFPAVAEQFKLKRHHGRAEAALIALYGAEVLVKGMAA